MKFNENYAVPLSVGGKDFVVGRHTLLSVEESVLAELFSGNAYLEKMKDGKVFLDRDPVVFEHLIRYLRSERSFVPRDLSSDMKNLLHLEFKYWKVDNGLLKPD